MATESLLTASHTPERVDAVLHKDAKLRHLKKLRNLRKLLRLKKHPRRLRSLKKELSRLSKENLHVLLLITSSQAIKTTRVTALILQTRLEHGKDRIRSLKSMDNLLILSKVLMVNIKTNMPNQLTDLRAKMEKERENQLISLKVVILRVTESPLISLSTLPKVVADLSSLPMVSHLFKLTQLAQLPTITSRAMLTTRAIVPILLTRLELGKVRIKLLRSMVSLLIHLKDQMVNIRTSMLNLLTDLKVKRARVKANQPINLKVETLKDLVNQLTSLSTPLRVDVDWFKLETVNHSSKLILPAQQLITINLATKTTKLLMLILLQSKAHRRMESHLTNLMEAKDIQA